MVIPLGKKRFRSGNPVGHAEVGAADTVFAGPAPVARANVARAAPPRTVRGGSEALNWGLGEETGLGEHRKSAHREKHMNLAEGRVTERLILVLTNGWSRVTHRDLGYGPVP